MRNGETSFLSVTYLWHQILTIKIDNDIYMSVYGACVERHWEGYNEIIIISYLSNDSLFQNDSST